MHMRSINKVFLVGNVGQTPKLIDTKTGNKMLVFSMATNVNYRNKTTGEWECKTNWHNITVYSTSLAESGAKHLTAGCHVIVMGALEYSTYKNRNGEEVHKTEIVITQFSGELSFNYIKEDVEVIPDSIGENIELRNETIDIDITPEQFKERFKDKINAKQPTMTMAEVIDDEIPF